MSSPMLYLVLLGFFHLGLLLPWALGVYDIGRIGWFEAHSVTRAISLVIYAVIAYQASVFVAMSRTSGTDATDADRRYVENSGVFAAGLVLFLIAVTMFLIGLIRLDPTGYYRLTYSETFRLRAESDPRFFGSGITIAGIGLCLLVSGATKSQMRIAFLCTGIWVGGLFYLGFRGLALIAGLIVYAVSLKKRTIFPTWLPWVAIALLLIAVPIERMIRDEPVSVRSVASSLRDISWLDAPAEMGASIRPLIETADIIDTTTYRYGRTYLTALKGVVPNLALQWEAPATESLDELPPGHWITAVVDPWSYRNYGGMGFSAVAEPYMNFGAAGVVVYFLLLGYGLVRLEQVSVRNSYTLAMWGLILGPLLWTTRNDSSNFFRPAIWGMVCLAVVHFYEQGYSLILRRRWGNKLVLQKDSAEIRRA